MDAGVFPKSIANDVEHCTRTLRRADDIEIIVVRVKALTRKELGIDGLECRLLSE